MVPYQNHICARACRVISVHTTVKRFGHVPGCAVFGPSPRRRNCALGHVLRSASRMEMVLHGSGSA